MIFYIIFYKYLIYDLNNHLFMIFIYLIISLTLYLLCTHTLILTCLMIFVIYAYTHTRPN